MKDRLGNGDPDGHINFHSEEKHANRVSGIENRGHHLLLGMVVIG